jgi:hypothetical protein
MPQSPAADEREAGEGVFRRIKSEFLHILSGFSAEAK